MSCAAAERKDMNKNHIGRQSQDVESFYNSVDGNICLASEKDSRNQNEERIILFGSGEVMPEVQLGKHLKRKCVINVAQGK
jgi:hypothetical protein